MSGVAISVMCVPVCRGPIVVWLELCGVQRLSNSAVRELPKVGGRHIYRRHCTMIRAKHQALVSAGSSAPMLMFAML
ncbi:hypothetical protein C8Q77DRAFT_1107481 [Trametes polyzona]|nr:hypothetical protein C8Q77DRAFT_1107481 [Trametes polyzona]